MDYPIQNISVKLNPNEENVIIPLEGSNLIIVGNNGAGKTRFLNRIFEWLNIFYSYHDVYCVESIGKQAEIFKKQLKHYKQDDQNYINFEGHYNGEVAKLRRLEELNIIFSSPTLFKREIKQKNVLLKFLQAQRKYESNQSNQLTSIESLFENYKHQNDNNLTEASSYFESFLVSMSNYSLLQKGSDNIDEFKRVDRTIRQIESDMKSLLESEDLKLHYNLSSLRMEILQKGREPLRFQMLPSGFASILAIYAELIMHAELRKINKDDLDGIVIIDEIDAHLHVTLQKKVFNFFAKSFPNIQFIISTHSPFVVQSVSDSVIFNLSTKEIMKDLSLYSYTSIISGLLGEATSSEELNNLLSELDMLSRESRFDDRFHELSAIIEKDLEKMDSKSKSIFMIAQNKFTDWEENE